MPILEPSIAVIHASLAANPNPAPDDSATAPAAAPEDGAAALALVLALYGRAHPCLCTKGWVGGGWGICVCGGFCGEGGGGGGGGGGGIEVGG